ncbi:fam-g protein [Plasmodium gallinaceum]|uniref:Fam-g protein n=1 Tax=Plasmodium gallinaceum TaxID=5849 RepID=A0A1J1GU01_PLAGA|nr:fam-g protein [Plasmodium gallinaceum]CRG96006.1 fam-g protein [Plasmodium gallinaceum]
MDIFIYLYNVGDSYKILIDKNRLQIKNELKYERVLTEGDIGGKKQSYGEECLEECPLDNKKNKWENPVRYENPYDNWNKVITPFLREEFNKETGGMDPEWREQKWNNEWNNISANKVNELSSIYMRSIPKKDKEKLICCVEQKLFTLFVEFLDKCKKEMRDNKTESESKKEKLKKILHLEKLYFTIIKEIIIKNIT